MILRGTACLSRRHKEILSYLLIINGIGGKMEFHALLSVHPHQFWQEWFNYWGEEQTHDPTYFEAIKVYLNPWPAEGLFNLHISVQINSVMKYQEQVREFIQVMEKSGWMVRNLTKEEEDYDAIRARLGANKIGRAHV